MAKRKNAPESATASMPTHGEGVPTGPSATLPSHGAGETSPANGDRACGPEQGNGESRKPAHVLSYLVSKDTFVQASIWERLVTVTDGSTFLTHDVSVRKRLRDAQSGEWKSLSSFRGSELYALLHAVAQASAWILEARASTQTVPF
jgi:hypothetical protein